MKKPTSYRGFSLVEVLFAMFFMGVIVFGVIKLQTSNVVLTVVRNNELQAYFLSTQGLEIMEAFGNTVIGATCGAPPCTCEAEKSGDYALTCTNTPETIGIFSRRFTVDSTDLNTSWKTVSTVEWTDNTGDHSVSAIRIINPPV